MSSTEEETHDAIAIIGMSCRFPGASSLDEFWRNLCDGRESLSEFTEAELRSSGVDPHWLAHPDYVPRGMILENVDQFDAAFFQLSAREASLMDPQQRLLLECSWEALESAGHSPGEPERRVGVYVGARISEYLLVNQRPPDLHGATTEPPLESFQRLLFNEKDYVATRIAHVLDLRGPAVTVQTACSTSLVAVHQACQALLNHECELALAGGSSVRVPCKAGYLHSEGMVFAPDGHTRSFDARARGTVFGSGVGVVALKRLDDALAHRDRIFAVIRGSAVNNDGARQKASFTAPSPAGQAAVVAEALAVADVDPGSVSYIEAHGTATALGDLIEITALTEVFGTPDRAVGSCAIGSVKSNIGHLVQASGVAGLIKTALMLAHKTLVPSLHFTEPNPRIDFASTPFQVNTVLRPWENARGPRRAGVSSFGFGGTNAHAVLEEAPLPLTATARCSSERHHVLTLSGRSPQAVRELAALYVRFLENEPAVDFDNLIWTAQVGRAHFDHRAAVVANSLETLRRHLADFASGRSSAHVFEGDLSNMTPPRIAFLFTGDGIGRLGEARTFHQTQPAFRDAVDRCADWLAPHLERPLIDILFGPDADRLLARTDLALPALCAWQVAIVSLWRSWGIEAAAMVGDGQGEPAAAWAAGVLSLEDALRLSVLRGRITGGPREVSNGFHTVPGDTAPVLEVLEARLRNLTVVPPGRLLLTTATDVRVFGDTLTDPAYRGRPSRFAEAMRMVEERGCDTLLEIGPDSTLSNPGRLSHLNGARPDISVEVFRNLAELYTRGVNPKWSAVHGDSVTSRCRVDLPTYPFQRQRYWIEPDRPAQKTCDSTNPGSAVSTGGHPLLGRRLASPLKDVQYQAELTAESELFLRDHWIHDTRPYPMAAFVEHLRAAAAMALRDPKITPVLEDVLIRQPLMLTAEATTIMQTIVKPGDDASEFQVFSTCCAEGLPWALHATGRIRGEAAAERPSGPVDLRAFEERCPEIVSGDEFYRARSALGANPGSSIKVVTEARVGFGEVLAHAELRAGLEGSVDAYGAHPALLDGCFQLAELCGARPSGPGLSARYLPTVIERVAFWGALPAHVRCHIRRRSDGPMDGEITDIQVFDSEGCVLMTMEGVYFKKASRAALNRDNSRIPLSTYLHEIVWQQAGGPSVGPSNVGAGVWLILEDQAGVGARLAEQIVARGGIAVSAGVGGDHQAIGERRAVIDPARPESFREVVNRVVRLSSAKTPYRGAVYLWGLDVPPEESFGDRDEALTCTGALHLAQALVAAEAITAPSDSPLPGFWVVTRGAQATGGEAGPLNPGQATLWGLGRVLLREQPRLNCRLVDLDPKLIDDAVSQLLSMLDTVGREEQTAFRGRERYAPRLHRISPAAVDEGSRKPLIAENATYLITGGVGALGLNVAQWLVESGARNLVLLARRPPSATAERTIRALTERGITVLTLQADVANYDELDQALQRIASILPPLQGIIHAAGVSDDATLSRLTSERFRGVLDPKTRGSWNLHRLTRSVPLDFFVVFSSSGALWGPPGRSSYAAANAFLDQFVAYRRRLGLPALSINFGAWRGGGLAVRDPRYEVEQRNIHGQEFLSPEEGLAAMAWAVGSDRTQVGVFHVDWGRFASQFTRDEMPRIFEDLVPVAMASHSAQFPSVSEAPAAALNDRARPRETREAIRDAVASMAGVPSLEVDIERPLEELGLDSLMLLLLGSRLADMFGEAGRLPVIRLLENPSIARLSALVEERLGQTQAREAAPVLAPGTTVAAERRYLEPVRTGQCGTHVVLVGDSDFVKPFLDSLPEDVPILWLKASDFHTDDHIRRSITELSEAYLEEIVRAAPEGSLVLVGFSYNGLLAFDMACRLQQSGRSVASMLLEPALPRALHVRETTARRVFRNLLLLRDLNWAEWPEHLCSLAKLIVRRSTHQHSPTINAVRSTDAVKGESSRRQEIHVQRGRNIDSYEPWLRARDTHLTGTRDWFRRYGSGWRDLVEGEPAYCVFDHHLGHGDMVRIPEALTNWLAAIVPRITGSTRDART